MTEIVPSAPSGVVPAAPAATPAAVVLADLQRFEAVILDQLDSVGLPHENVFVDPGQRHRMLTTVDGALDRLDAATRARSHYISKMIAAAAVGLFDAALNYLWDETVSELRRRVLGFDLVYFYDTVAGTNTDFRKSLRDEDDLTKVDDAHLLRASREIGLLTEVGFTRLDHIRFMRNHASAAHPNQTELTGLDLAQWLEVCVIHVITTPPDHITAQTGRLLANIKTHRLDAAAAGDAATFFANLPSARADTLANGFFGLYTAPGRSEEVADNIRTLWVSLWPYVGEDTRGSYGVRYARFRADADTDRASAARELLDLVDGLAYLPTDLWVAEVDRALDALVAAHVSFNNFYNEAAPARTLAQLVGSREIPAEMSVKYILTVVEMFLGNGYGVAHAAEPTYRSLLENLSATDARIALYSFGNEAISSLLSNAVAQGQWDKLLAILEPKLTRPADRALLEAIRAFTGTPAQLRADSKIKKLRDIAFKP